MSLTSQQILFDRYRIDQIIGRGGFGAVYYAWDLRLSMAVAVKENLETSPQSQKQFEREGHLLARLSHPNLPRVIDHFIIPDQGQYLVMDFIEGDDLRSLLKRHGPLPEPQVLTWLTQICDALHYLHSQTPPIIHRDIKPANIKIRPDGRALLVDFGIAKLFNPDSRTTVGARGITPGYSPPEQYGDGGTDARSDIYALGVTLFSLLTNTPPPASLDRMLNNQVMPSPRQINPSITPAVEQIILQATELPTEKRFQTVQQLQNRLSQITTPRVQPPFTQQATELLTEPPTSRPLYQQPILLAAGLIAMLIILGSIGFVSGLFNSANQATAQPEALAIIEPTNTPTPTATTTATPTITPTPSPAPTNTPLPSKIYLEYVIDASNSMLENLSGDQTKLQAVQQALADHWATLQPPPNIGLRVYGHRFDALNQTQSCLDTELLLPPRQGEINHLVEAVNQLTGRGRSPLAEAIRAASGDFTFTAEQTNGLIVIADSGDSCGHDPCQMLQFQRDAGLRYPVYVIGLGVDDQAQAALRCIAAESGGLYHEANNEAELRQALAEFGRLLIR